MSWPEAVLAAAFVSIWVVPLGLALAWERRCRDLAARVEARSREECT